MLDLAFGTIRTRLTSFVGAFVAVLLCAMMVTAAGVMLESAKNTKTPVERLDGVDAAVAATGKISATPQSPPPTEEDEDKGKKKLPERPRVPAELAAKIAAVPGVAAAVADRTVDVVLPDGKAVEAHGWDSAALMPVAPASGRAPVGPREIVAQQSAGEQVKVTTPQGEKTYTVVGTVGGKDVFFSSQEAARLTGLPDKADFIGVVAAPDADKKKLNRDLAAAAEAYEKEHGPLYGDPARWQPTLRVVTGGGLGAMESPDADRAKADAIELAGFSGYTVSFVAVFVVAGAFGFSIQQRTREIGMLRAIGASPRQIRKMVSAEALLVSLAASAAGVLLGYPFARVMKAGFDYADAVPPGFTLVNGSGPAWVGAGTAVVTTQLAAYFASSRAAKVKPAEVVAGSAKRSVLGTVTRYTTGVLTLAGGVAVTVWSMKLGGEDGAEGALGIVFTFLIAFALLGRPIARVAAALLGRLFRTGGGAPGELAHANSTVNPARISAVATPIMLFIALTCTLLFTGTGTSDLTGRQGDDRTTASYILGGREGVGLPVSKLDEVRKVPGVTAATGTVATQAYDGRKATAHGVDAAVGDVLNLGVTSGDVRDLTGDTVAISKLRADTDKRVVGDSVEMWLGDGTPVKLKVVAVYKNALGFGDYLIPRELVAPHSTDLGLEAVYVAGDADREKLLATGAELMDRDTFLNVADFKVEQNAKVNTFILGLISLFVAVSVANKLVMATGQRSREFALLRLVGTTRRQILSMVRRETAVIAVLGIGLGSAIAWVTLGAFASGLGGGFHPVFPPATYLAVVGATVVLAYAASLIPARMALRKDPVTEIGSRE